MILSQLSGRERKVLILTLVIVLGAIVYGLFLEPGIRLWKDSNEQIASRKRLLERNVRIIARKDSAENEYVKFASFIKKVGSDEDEKTSMLKHVEILAAKNNVKIIQIKPREVEEFEYYKIFSIEIESRSGVEAQAKFIYALQNSPQVLKVTNLRLAAKGSGAGVLKSVMVITKIVAI